MSMFDLQQLASAGLRSAREWWLVVDGQERIETLRHAMAELQAEIPPAPRPEMTEAEARAEINRLFGLLPRDARTAAIRTLALGEAKRAEIDKKLEARLGRTSP